MFGDCNLLSGGRCAAVCVCANGHRCQFCGKTYTLEVHHLTYYDENGQSIVGREAEHLDKLITLCGECHQKQHRK